jgi:hypothetical protein
MNSSELLGTVFRWTSTALWQVLQGLGTEIVQWYSAGVWSRWSEVRVPAGDGNFSPYHHVQTGSGAHKASYPVCTRGSFPAGKAVGFVKLTTHLHLVPRSRIRGAVTPLPQNVFMAWCSPKAQGQLYAYLSLCSFLSVRDQVSHPYETYTKLSYI